VKGKSLGLLIGVVVGVVWAWLGFKDLLLVALCGFIGWLIVGVLEGELDVRNFYDNLRRK
jgi:hypothetical protein